MEKVAFYPLQVIDFNYKDLFLLRKTTIGQLNLLVNKQEVTITHDSPISLFKIPEVIYEVIVEKPITSYSRTDGSGNKTILKEEYEIIRANILKNAEIDEDGDVLWNTKEDKKNYDAFINSWVPEYATIKLYKEVPFEVIKKEFVPYKYEDFIYSSVVTGDLKGHYTPFKAVCNYVPNFGKMVSIVAKELGFSILPNNTNLSATNGKKCIIRGLTGTRINGAYINFDTKLSSFKLFYGSLVDCIKRYNDDYSVIKEKFTSIANLIDHPEVTSVEREEISNDIDKCIKSLKSIESKQQTIGEYNILMNRLLKLSNKIKMIGT